ncbi:MAG: hypothetical protein HZC40_08625 [Chloroflexi bacterium]|nr:hypothetical protein [Chloroflexota bacterium]
MTRQVIVICFLVSLFIFLLAFALTPVRALEARDETGARVLCIAISAGDDLVYHSINSIYRVPVEEHLRVESDGLFVPLQVISTPDVIYYYGIEDFTRLDDVRVRAIPRATRYRELRFKIGAPGQQRVITRGQTITLSDFAPNGQAIIFTLQSAPRVFACR